MPIFKKPKTTKPQDPKILDTRIAELRELDKGLLAEQLELERGGAGPIDEANLPPTERRALQLLAGEGAAAITLPQLPGVRLAKVIAERNAIARALQLAGDQLWHAQIEAVNADKLRRAAEWDELLRGRAMAILALQKINRRCEAFALSVGGSTGRYTGLRCQVGPNALLGRGAGRDPADQFVAAVRDAGVITEGEIQKEREGK